MESSGEIWTGLHRFGEVLRSLKKFKEIARSGILENKEVLRQKEPTLSQKFGEVWRGFERFGEVCRGFERFQEVSRGLERFLEVL